MMTNNTPAIIHGREGEMGCRGRLTSNILNLVFIKTINMIMKLMILIEG